MRNVFTYYDEKDYLAHWGIKGQKWGIRRFQNPDGSLTEAGRERYARNNRKQQPAIHNLMDKVSYKDDVSDKVFSMLHADKKYLKQANDICQQNTNVQKQITKEVDDMFEDLRSPGKMHVYEAASELAAYAQYARTSDWARKYYKDNVDDMTLDQLGQAGFMGVLEDGQQSDVNAYSMYASEHNYANRVTELGRTVEDSNSKTRAAVEDVLARGLSEVGADSLTAYPKNDKYTLAKALTMHKMNSDKYDKWEETSGSWYLNQAERASTFTKQDRDNIQKAKDYVTKLKNAGDQNTWWYVTEAAENLGMSSAQLKNLTQSDWNRINREIQKLKDND